MSKAFGIILALLILASASSSTGWAERCSVAGSSWPDHVGPWPPMPNAFPAHIEVRLTSEGRSEIRTDGIGIGDGWKPVSQSELRQILQIADTLTPQPYVVVDIAPEAACDRVRALAAELEKLSMCQKRKCVTRKAWRNYSA